MNVSVAPQTHLNHWITVQRISFSLISSRSQPTTTTFAISQTSLHTIHEINVFARDLLSFFVPALIKYASVRKRYHVHILYTELASIVSRDDDGNHKMVVGTGAKDARGDEEVSQQQLHRFDCMLILYR